MTERVTILLSTFDGEIFLKTQLDSILAQSFTDWKIAWRDDGSSDRSVAVMEAFAQSLAPGRCVQSQSSGPHLGAASSFLLLLAENSDSELVAFADQDDRWLPDKLQRAADRLGTAGTAPMLYCSRQMLTDEDLSHPVLSMRYAGSPGFPASLTQNIATGNTIVMNREAARLVSGMPAPEASPHDWWSYIVVSACGGLVVYDPEPSLLYRQHTKNLIGAQLPIITRAIAAIERGPGIYMTMMRRHTARLEVFRDRLSAQARIDLDLIRLGLVGGVSERLSAVRCEGFRRATKLETLLFQVWFLMR